MPPTDHGPTPPSTSGEPAAHDTRADDPDVIAQLAQLLDELVPEELQRRLAAAIRELLVALHALLDWLVERLERRAGEAAEVRDIPIL